MNSNRPNNLFHSRRLSREDIETYSTTENSVQKNAIEQKAASNSFDGDAFEGWETHNFDLSNMKKLDSKFGPKSPLKILKQLTATIIGVTGIVFLFIYNLNQDEQQVKQNDTVSTTSQMIKVEESDVITPQQIEEMNVAPIKQQIAPKVIQSEFAERKTLETTKSIEVEVNQLPPNELTNTTEGTIISTRKNVKEIYLSDLKLIDYSSFRAEPSIKTKQILLTGTPANMESKESEDIDAVWQTVEIPYNDYLEKTLRILNHSNYKKALSRFEIILKTYPNDLNAQFYSGYCLFNLGEYELSLSHFQKCIDGLYSNFDEESEWMIAQAYQLDGNQTKANQLFKSIVAKNGYYAKQAKSKISN